MESLENHALGMHFDARMKCKDANGQVRGLRWDFYTKLQQTNSIAFFGKPFSQGGLNKHKDHIKATKPSIQSMDSNHNIKGVMNAKRLGFTT